MQLGAFLPHSLLSARVMASAAPHMQAAGAAAHQGQRGGRPGRDPANPQLKAAAHRGRAEASKSGPRRKGAALPPLETLVTGLRHSVRALDTEHTRQPVKKARDCAALQVDCRPVTRRNGKTTTRKPESLWHFCSAEEASTTTNGRTCAEHVLHVFSKGFHDASDVGGPQPLYVAPCRTMYWVPLKPRLPRMRRMLKQRSGACSSRSDARPTCSRSVGRCMDIVCAS